LTRTARSGELFRHDRRELWLLGLVGALILIPWLVGLGVGFWFLVQRGWAWHWWVGSVLLITLGFWLLSSQLSRRQPPRTELFGTIPGASEAERKARQALQQRAEAVTADSLASQDAVRRLLQGAFQDVAQAYSPDDQAALWRFTLPELLLMVEDFAQSLRATLQREFPVARHIELSWVVKLSGLADPASLLLSAWRLFRWINPSQALLAELRGTLSHQALSGFGEIAKVQIGATLIEQAGETAIRLYSGGYRRRADELLPTAPKPLPDTPSEPLTILLAGRRGAGKSALLNALLGKAEEPVGLLTPSTAGCRAYEFQSVHAGKLILVDSPGTDGKANEPWLAQAARSDLVLWVAAVNRADRAADQRALAALDALTDRSQALRQIPRVLVLTHADKLDPPLEWAPPYVPENPRCGKEYEMREAKLAACEQLHLPLQQCALVAVRPGEPLWNKDALEKAILGVLPEAQQKQLERGLRDDGWFKKSRDAVITVPSAYEKIKSFGPQMLKKILREVDFRQRHP
jgi:predicted GTPase